MSKKLSLITTALLAGISAFAQNIPDSSKTLNEVIVTANKFPQKQNSTGKVIAVIPWEVIEKSAGKSLGQLLNEQAGITINGALNSLGSNQTLYVRGAAGGRALVLIDGIPVYDPSFISNEFDLNFIALNQVERIEICRGAQSTIYGSDAVAGVINIITIKQDISKPINLNAGLSGGSFGTIKANAQLYGKTGKLTYMARYAKIKSDGFSAAYDSTGKKSFDNDGYNGDIAGASLKLDISTSASLNSYVQYSRYKTDLDAGIFTDEKDYTNTNKALRAGGSFHYVKDNISLTASYQYAENSRSYLNDSIDVPGFVKYSTDKYKSHSQYAEVYTNIRLGGGFTLLQGADYRYSGMNSKFFSLSSFGPFTSSFSDTSHSQASLFASVLFSGLEEKLNIELGGRLNVHSRYGSNNTYTFNPSFAINKNFRVFGSIASAFKAPTLYQLYSAYGNQLLKPEYSTTVEGGIQEDHGIIKNRLVYFRRKITDGLDFDNINYQYYNISSQTVRGIEWESVLRATKQLTITFNYTYLSPDEQTQSRVSFKDTVYHYLLRRPQHNLNILAGYQLNNKLYVSIGAKYAAKRYDAGGYQAPDILLDPYFIMNAYGEYKCNKQVKFFADVQNLTNKKFFDVRGFNSIPFTIQAGVSVNL
jgi:vitamin B12 transporter